MEIDRSEFFENTGVQGGAIKNYGHLTITNSTFEDNTAGDYGGAIYNTLGSIYEMDLTIENSTFTGNTATSYDGGAIFTESHAGVTITNSTFFNNTAGLNGGAIYHDTAVQGDEYLSIIHSTFSENYALDAAYGAGVVSFGYLKIVNSIIANSAGGSDCYWNFPGGGIFVHNLIQATSSPYNCGTPILTGGPMLSPLAENGGPTETMALLSASPAIDVGHADHCTPLDQRGILPRPQGGGCDLGAYELDSYPTVVSIERAEPNPTSQTHLDFTVTFNEPVTGVDKTDFIGVVTGSVGSPNVFAVSGADDQYTVTVRISLGNGTLRLDLVDNDSIQDDGSRPLGGTGAGNGDFTSGEVYTVIDYQYVYLPLVMR